MRHLIFMLVLTVSALGLFNGCTDDDGNGSSCTAGNTQNCTCDSGLAGSQTCQEDGTWGACTGCSDSDVIDDVGDDVMEDGTPDTTEETSEEVDDDTGIGEDPMPETPDEPECTPDCTGMVCGLDPVCGQPCGVCVAESQECVDGQCTPWACLDANDVEALMGDEVNLDEVLPACGMECSAEQDPGACFGGCFEDATGASGSCSECFAENFFCAMEHCGEDCSEDPNSEVCLGCQIEHCEGDFAECTGFAKPYVQDRCLNQNDLSILADGGDEVVIGQVTTCGMGCLMQPNPVMCVLPCIIDDTGLTPPCSMCYGEMVSCLMEFCAEPCVADSEGEACLTCQAENCLPQFYVCTGLAPLPEDQCVGDEDMAVINEDIDAVYEDVFGCGYGCLEDLDPKDCTQTCIATETGLTEGCTGCFGYMFECTASNCTLDCVIDSNGYNCLQCIADAGCHSGFDVCTGVDSPAFDQCTVPDVTAYQAAPDMFDDAYVCAEACPMDDDFETCATACFDGLDAVTAECLACFIYLPICQLGDCEADCVEPEGCPECLAKCENNAHFCAGIPPITEDCNNWMDQPILDGWEVPYDCARACESEQDVPACVDACVDEQDELTDPCATCLTDYATCAVLGDCVDDCGDGMDPVVCDACMTANCYLDYLACSGMPHDAGIDACQNDDDQAILTGGVVDVNTITEGCFETCLESDDIVLCNQGCVAEESGLSFDCTWCYTDMSTCLLNTCLLPCSMNAEGMDCISCALASGCLSTFSDCTGFDEPEPEGACLGEDDAALLEGDYQGIVAAATACGEPCSEDDEPAICAQDCIEDTGLTPECSACFGDIIECSIEFCPTECAAGAFDADCIACQRQNGCLAAFGACTGRTN